MGQVNELKNFTRGQLDAALMQIGHEAEMGTAEGIRAFLRGDLRISSRSRSDSSWHEKDGVIRFSVTSDGTMGEDWINRLEGNGFRIEGDALQVLRSPSFKPTRGVVTEVAVLRGILFQDNYRTTENIRADADRRNLSKPNAEIACLIRLKFTDEEIKDMGLWWVVAIHEPINNSRGVPVLLYVSCTEDGRWFRACNLMPGSRWGRNYGFAFAVSSSAQSAVSE